MTHLQTCNNCGSGMKCLGSAPTPFGVLRKYRCEMCGKYRYTKEVKVKHDETFIKNYQLYNPKMANNYERHCSFKENTNATRTN